MWATAMNSQAPRRIFAGTSNAANIHGILLARHALDGFEILFASGARRSSSTKHRLRLRIGGSPKGKLFEAGMPCVHFLAKISTLVPFKISPPSRSRHSKMPSNFRRRISILSRIIFMILYRCATLGTKR